MKRQLFLTGPQSRGKYAKACNPGDAGVIERPAYS